MPDFLHSNSFGGCMGSRDNLCNIITVLHQTTPAHKVPVEDMSLSKEFQEARIHIVGAGVTSRNGPVEDYEIMNEFTTNVT